MLKKIYVMITLVVLTVNVIAKECVPVGGMALANAISETSLVAALTGDMTGARAEILKQTKTKTGLLLDMEHFFVNDKGGMLHTKDKATLTKIPAREGIYMLEINYIVSKSFGTLKGYTGSFSSYGLMKLNEGKVVLRYQGQLCK